MWDSVWRMQSLWNSITAGTGMKFYCAADIAVQGHNEYNVIAYLFSSHLTGGESLFPNMELGAKAKPYPCSPDPPDL